MDNQPPKVPLGIQDAIRTILQYIGEDPTREGLRETPNRIVRSYDDLFSGYHKDPSTIFTTFEDGACDEIVVLRKVPVVSFCEHHMLPFSGLAHIGYLPKGKIVGISKLARLLDIYARRLQVQERLTTQITDALEKYLEPRGAGCVIECIHSCMTCRGVMKHNSILVTSSLTGAFRHADVKQEFFDIVKGLALE